MIPDFGNNRQNYTLMAEQIASRGYIVASIDHKTISNMIKFPDGIYTQKFLSLYKNKTNNKMTKHHYKSINDTLKSISFFINNLNEIDASLMEGCIDRNNIFLLGFGFGSNIAAACDIYDVKGVIGVNQKKFNSSIVAKYLEKQSQIQMKDKKVLFLNSNDFDPMEKSSCTLHINGQQNDLSDFDNMDIGVNQLLNFVKFKMKLEPLITSQNQKDSNICTTVKIASIIGSFLENNIRFTKSDVDYNKIGIIISDKTDHRINTILNQNKITPYNVTSGYINYFIDNISFKSNPEHGKNMIIIANPKYHHEAIKAAYNRDFIDKVILIGSESKVGKNQNMEIETYDLNGKPIIINDRDPKIKHIKKDILIDILSDLHNLIRE